MTNQNHAEDPHWQVLSSFLPLSSSSVLASPSALTVTVPVPRRNQAGTYINMTLHLLQNMIMCLEEGEYIANVIGKHAAPSRLQSMIDHRSVSINLRTWAVHTNDSHGKGRTVELSPFSSGLGLSSFSLICRVLICQFKENHITALARDKARR